MNTLLAQASEALKKGYRQQARRLLDELVVQEPKNQQAWLLLAEAVEHEIERIDCLKIALAIDPDDEFVRERLHRLASLPPQPKAGTGPARKPAPASKPNRSSNPNRARNPNCAGKPGPDAAIDLPSLLPQPRAVPFPASKTGPDAAIELPPGLSLPAESDWPEPEDPGAFKPDKKILLALVKMDPQNEEAWIQLSRQAETPEVAAECLRRVLAINPNNTIVKMKLTTLLEILKNKKPEET